MRGCTIFSGSSHPKLVDAVCERLGQKPANASLKKFSNGETSVEIRGWLNGSSSTNAAPLTRQQRRRFATKKSSLCKVGAATVMPYYPYSRQSKKKTHRGAITARMIANQLKVAGVDHVITIDLHASQMQGFFKCPVDNLRAEPLLAKWIRMNIPDSCEAVVVSKNPGGTKRVTSLADALQLSFGIVTTERRRPHCPSSLYNSTVFEPMGMDGTNEHEHLDEEASVAEASTSERGGKGQEHTNHSNHQFNGHSHGRQPGRIRTATTWPASLVKRLANGTDAPSSPLANSRRADSTDREDEASSPTLGLNRVPTAPGISQARHDDDGYEESGEDENDESARDVITGRLIHGHIVDDDVPSPGMSVQSASLYGNNFGQRSNSDEEPPDMMLQSFMSTTSSRMQPPRAGLGGTGDATASDEEEEEALQNPEIESTVTLVGNVRDKPVLIVDDMIDKAGSWIAAAETVVKRGGATKVYCMATHGLFGGNSLRELDECDEIEAIVVTDAFPIPEEKRHGVKKLVVLDVSGLLAEAIRRNHHGESITQLYQHFE
ncbi:ribose-phosphate pyrophosphokinase 1 [Vermiconidia calcicola]|uniref:Ribose-phosphate pyrophosphokinase 1 n=1 Tax=Vermiconidia calcicola TaxID=1690605 RepID=A0ACC3MZJ4_9PEZI|nr:ribose-phosphate pyrophosphokinase 1 [Vermiconidia calcicola]